MDCDVGLCSKEDSHVCLFMMIFASERMILEYTGNPRYEDILLHMSPLIDLPFA